MLIFEPCPRQQRLRSGSIDCSTGKVVPTSLALAYGRGLVSMTVLYQCDFDDVQHASTTGMDRTLAPLSLFVIMGQVNCKDIDRSAENCKKH